MLDQIQIDQQLQSLGASLQGDENLFALIDLRLPPEEQIPRIMVGEQAKGMIRNGHYHARFVGPNSSSKVNLRQKQIEKIKAENPDFQVPKSVAQQLSEAEAKIAELQAAEAAAKAAAEKEAQEKAKAAEAAANKGK